MERRGGWTCFCVVVCCLLALLLGGSAALAQGTLTNGGNHTGTLNAGQEHVWTFAASQNDAVTISIGEVGGDTSYVPLIVLRRPDGVQLAIDWGGRAARIHVPALPVSGTYTVAASGLSDSAGPYRLTLAQSPGPYVVPAGDEGGVLTNGSNHHGQIPVGDLDQWHFTAGIGDAVTIMIGEILPSGADPGFVPQIWIRRPDGVQLAIDWGGVAARLHLTSLPLTGIYTVVVGSQNIENGGEYRLTLAHSPSLVLDVPSDDEGGAFQNGNNHRGRIHVGDLDQWRFDANIGDAVTVMIGEIVEGEIDPGFVPQIWIRGPDGTQLGLDWGGNAALLHVPTLPRTGTYTVVVGSQNLSTGGAYTLTLAHSPGTFVVPQGDEGGVITNGGNHRGAIHVGDMDQWRFTANRHDAVTIEIGEVLVSEVDPGFVPQILLRAPNGAELGNTWGGLAARVHVADLPLTGVYTVMVLSQNHATAGQYVLTLAQSPGQVVVPTDDQGGPLTNGDNHQGAIHVGDMDQWQFTANQGDALSLSLGEVLVGEVDPGFVPQIWLRGPDGAQLSNDWGGLDAQANVTAPLTGTYTAIVASQNLSTAGFYRLVLARTPAPFIVPAGDDGGAMTNGVEHSGTIPLADLDLWTFNAVQGAAITINISEVHVGQVDPGFVPWIRLRGPDGADLGNTWGGETARISRTAPTSGLYTVVVGGLSSATLGHYTISVTGAINCQPSASLASSTFPHDGGAGVVVVSALDGCPWTVTSQTPWLVLTSANSGSGNGGVNFTVQPNITGSLRTGTFNVSGQVVTVLQSAAPVSPTDQDGDGLDDTWETRFGLNINASGASDGAGGDPDGDGRTNLQELQEDTHPRGFVITYLAEGATGAFFRTRLALANPTPTPALVLVRFQKGSGEVVREYFSMLPMSRKTIDVATVPGMAAAEFSTLIEADVQIVADRTMTWDATGYGSHAERGIIARTATTWYFAEGATHSGFALFFLLQNPTDTPATVEVTYLRPSPAPALIKSYAIGAQSRFNIWVNAEAANDPALAPLAATDISAVVRSTNGVAIVAERAMYLNSDGLPFGAGHESAGVTELSPSWFFAEGATGAFFDLFLLIGNPGDQAAEVQATYLLPNGSTIVRQYVVGARSRFNIWVDLEEPQLADTAVSTTLTSLNGVPIVAERAMWWPGPAYAPQWYEAHNSPGATATGTRWALAEGESGGATGVETYVLIANTSSTPGEARVTLLFEDGTTTAQTFPLLPNSRFNVALSPMFPSSLNQRYGTIVESIGPTPVQIVVERAMYTNAGGVVWAAGSNALATRLP